MKKTNGRGFNSSTLIKIIVTNALIASLYAVVTILCAPLSYSFMQFRFSELLNLLVFFNPYYTIGLTLGCLLSNLMSTSGMYDIIFGTLATLVSCLLMIGFSKLTKNLFFSGLIPCIVNAIVVPFVIYLASNGTEDAFTLTLSLYFYMALFVFIGEFVCINVLGYIIFMVLAKKYKGFYELIDATTNKDFKW